MNPPVRIHRCACCQDLFPCCEGPPVVCPGTPWDRALCHDCERGHCATCAPEQFTAGYLAPGQEEPMLHLVTVSQGAVRNWLSGPDGPFVIIVPPGEGMLDAEVGFRRAYRGGGLPDRHREQFDGWGLYLLDGGDCQDDLLRLAPATVGYDPDVLG